jgi:SagB-type dehydrogenase family enzyme
VGFTYETAVPRVIQTAEEYERALASRKLRGLITAAGAHRVNLRYRPSKFCVIRGATSIPLPSGISHGDLKIGVRRVREEAGYGSAEISVGEISDLLLLSGGILARKMSICWRKEGLQAFADPRLRFSRGVPSGGGLYPYCIYVVSLISDGLPCGVYHYDVAHHALHRVRVGCHSGLMQQAMGDSAADKFDLAIVIVGRFWQSAFKYGHFAYKVMMQDVGALLGGMECVAFCLNWETRIRYRFNDALVGQLLGLNDQVEAPFVALAARRKYRFPTEAKRFTRASVATIDLLHRTEFKHQECEMDMWSLAFVRNVHRSTLLQGIDEIPKSKDPAPIAIPETNADKFIGADLVAAMLRRETSWGQIVSGPCALGYDDVEAIISFAFFGAAYAADVYASVRGLSLLRVELFARGVDGLVPGRYRYDDSTAQLVFRPSGAVDTSAGHPYVSNHQNVDQAPVVLVLIGRLREAVHQLGQRGVRVMNAEAGMFASRVYLACAVWSLGCGAALGFDAAALNAILDLDIRDEVPLLVIPLGPRRPRAIAFDFQLAS